VVALVVVVLVVVSAMSCSWSVLVIDAVVRVASLARVRRHGVIV